MAIILILVGKCICTMKTFDFSLNLLTICLPAFPLCYFSYHYLNNAAATTTTATAIIAVATNNCCIKMNESTELFTI